MCRVHKRRRDDDSAVVCRVVDHALLPNNIRRPDKVRSCPWHGGV